MFIMAGVALFMILVPFILLMRWTGRTVPSRREFNDPAYPQFPSQSSTTPTTTRSISAWTCLKPNCRNRNKAGAQYCARCGATRGFTYRVDDQAGDTD